jgi:hypothetical protein
VQLPDVTASTPASAASGNRSARRESTESPALNPATDSRSTAKKPQSPGSDNSPNRPLPETPAVAINRPLSLDPAPPPAARSVTPDGSAVTSTANTEPASRAGGRIASEPVARESSTERGRVWVKVPRSYYYNASSLPGRKEPSQEDLQKLVVRTEELIRKGIDLVVPLPGALAWETTIDLIVDDGPMSRPPIVSSPTDARRVAVDWGIAGAMGATATALFMLVLRVLSVRRPPSRLEPATAPGGLRYHRGASATVGPSERVREFVRRNPESARSVLERWTSQGVDPS